MKEEVKAKTSVKTNNKEKKVSSKTKEIKKK